MQKVIGIISNSINKNSENPFDYRYYTLNNYVKKIVENNAIAISILFIDDKIIKGSLDLCDGFIIPGGNNIIDAYQDIIRYAIKKDKPLLGICMGHQALGKYKSKNNLVLASNHYDDINSKKEINKLSHYININKNSKLYDILKKDRIKVNSLHHYKINKVDKNFLISATSDDGVIEAIEYKNKKFIIGVEFHPEIMEDMNNLFKTFIDMC